MCDILIKNINESEVFSRAYIKLYMSYKKINLLI